MVLVSSISAGASSTEKYLLSVDCLYLVLFGSKTTFILCLCNACLALL